MVFVVFGLSGPVRAESAAEQAVRDRHAQESEDLAKAQDSVRAETVKSIVQEGSGGAKGLPVFRGDELNQKLKADAKKQDDDRHALFERQASEEEALRKQSHLRSAQPSKRVEIISESSPGGKISTTPLGAGGRNRYGKGPDPYAGKPALDGSQVPKEMDFSNPSKNQDAK